MYTSLRLPAGSKKYSPQPRVAPCRVGPASIGLQWRHLPSVEDSGEASQPTPNTTGNGHSYDLFGLNGSFDVTDNFTIRGGVDNLFNRAPPLTGYNTTFSNDGSVAGVPRLRGGAYNSQFYDTLGRTFYIGANAKF